MKMKTNFMCTLSLSLMCQRQPASQPHNRTTTSLSVSQSVPTFMLPVSEMTVSWLYYVCLLLRTIHTYTPATYIATAARHQHSTKNS